MVSAIDRAKPLSLPVAVVVVVVVVAGVVVVVAVAVLVAVVVVFVIVLQCMSPVGVVVGRHFCPSSSSSASLSPGVRRRRWRLSSGGGVQNRGPGSVDLCLFVVFVVCSSSSSWGSLTYRFESSLLAQGGALLL